ncbi:hypothetical protein DPSP01_004939 [Paraphaeosphaeria sporulosa]|uniref:Uncharacterized protein n=1 Tax=Paraphaeosphaeria sporulosa TaxID=1460663 RepID=A0A177C790_9PLEO|nr:uncharacterized protein CC84DRAFT_963993 [Paraphaeosphaeria sporulosa]OAG03276.1 hypothetical protein CC84DRAFT_963993 [Paraphaeosphaeria sporulosa]
MVQTSFITLLLPALALAAPWAAPNAPASSAAYSTAVAQPTSTSLPSTTGGKVTFKNNCDYDVTYEQLCPCGSSDGSGTISAGATWSDSISDCSGGNTALKLFKDGGSKPMQFEYGIQSGNIWYDMSFIDCVSGSDDFSQCAGSAWSMGAADSCPTYSCSGGSECCIQGYCDPTASVASEQPVGACGANQGFSASSVGVSIEICGA